MQRQTDAWDKERQSIQPEKKSLPPSNVTGNHPVKKDKSPKAPNRPCLWYWLRRSQLCLFMQVWIFLMFWFETRNHHEAGEMVGNLAAALCQNLITRSPPSTDSCMLLSLSLHWGSSRKTGSGLSVREVEFLV